MDFERVNMDELSEEELLKYARQGELIFKLNHTMPMTPEYDEILKELFGDNLGENSRVMAPISGAALDKLVIGDNVFINSNETIFFFAFNVTIKIITCTSFS